MSKELERALETEQYENMEYIDTGDIFKEYDISGVSDEYLDYAYTEKYYD